MYEEAKRVLDIIAAIVGLALLCLLLPALAVAIKLDSPGPIFFAQKRIGRFGR
ncbi:MAG TPA: anti-anti-sigma factor, partial [Armatimonadetes bacterium]|nr:anti-anti-sigma factor [Armatimonadota bacterium]